MVDLEFLQDSEDVSQVVDDELWFVTCIANPLGSRARTELFKKFKQHVLFDLRARLLVVECVFDEGKDHEFAGSHDESSPSYVHLAVRSRSIMFNKENLLNIGIRALPVSATLVCWCDADITFANKNAVKLISSELRRRKVVQCFEHCLDRGRCGDVSKIDSSFMFCHAHGLTKTSRSDATRWHSGYVWAARKSFLCSIDLLFEQAILGAADRLMAHAFVGDTSEFELSAESRGDIRAFLEWSRALARVGFDPLSDCGYVPVVIDHGFHGDKKDRQYSTRGQILVENRFDPARDLSRNADGVFEWARAGTKLESDLVAYFRNRREE